MMLSMPAAVKRQNLVKLKSALKLKTLTG